jgi:hypothetical protein
MFQVLSLGGQSPYIQDNYTRRLHLKPKAQLVIIYPKTSQFTGVFDDF